jgi:hypothetical protein
LNRLAEEKKDVFVVDFYNKTCDIVKSFETHAGNASMIPEVQVNPSLISVAFDALLKYLFIS